LEDGSELARFVGDGEDVLVRCAAALNVTDDVVIHIANSEARAFRVGDDISLVWRHEFEGPVGGHSPAIDGHFVVTSFLLEEGAGIAVTALNAQTGEVGSAISISGRQVRPSPAAIEPVGDSLLVVSTEGNLRVDPALTLIDASRGALQVIWVQTYGEGDDAPPKEVVRLGDHLVGWTNRGRGARLAGFSLETGERIWSHVPESGAAPMVAVVRDDTAVISAHPRAWLEFVGGDDRDSLVIGRPDGYSRPNQITVVTDRTVVVTGTTADGGVYLEFVDI
jgi:hypothetical protein